MRLTRRIVALAAVASLVLAGCSSNEDETQSEITEETTSAEQAPSDDESGTPAEVDAVISDEGMPSIVEKDGIVSLDFEGATEPDQLQVSVVEEGDGREVAREDLVFVNYAGQVWGSDTTFDSSYVRGALSAFPLNSVVQGWRDGLAGQKVGSRVIISVPADLGYGPMGGNDSAGIGETDTIVFVVDIDNAIAPDETGDPEAKVVTDADELPVDIEGGLGELSQVTVKEGEEEPTELDSIVVAEGSGEKVGSAGTTVYFQYSAATWNNGQAESSIDFGGVQNTTIGGGSAFDALEGVPIGSRVLLLVPGDEETPSMAALVDVVAQLPPAQAVE